MKEQVKGTSYEKDQKVNETLSDDALDDVTGGKNGVGGDMPPCPGRKKKNNSSSENNKSKINGDGITFY